MSVTQHPPLIENCEKCAPAPMVTCLQNHIYSHTHNAKTSQDCLTLTFPGAGLMRTLARVFDIRSRDITNIGGKVFPL